MARLDNRDVELAYMDKQLRDCWSDHNKVLKKLKRLENEISKMGKKSIKGGLVTSGPTNVNYTSPNIDYTAKFMAEHQKHFYPREVKKGKFIIKKGGSLMKKSPNVESRNRTLRTLSRVDSGILHVPPDWN